MNKDTRFLITEMGKSERRLLSEIKHMEARLMAHIDPLRLARARQVGAISVLMILAGAVGGFIEFIVRNTF